MSNTGAGSAALLALPVALAGALVVGAGVLCYKGIMYCGDQLDKQYAEMNKSIAAQKLAVARAQLARVDTTQQYFKVEQRRMAAHAARLELEALPPATVAETAVNMRAFISGGRVPVETLAQAENRYLRERLEAEARVGTGRLPEALLTKARQSLQSTKTSSQEIQSLLDEFDAAWKQATAKSNDQQYDRPQLDLRLKELRAWLASLETSIANHQELNLATYTPDLQRIRQHITAAEQLPTAAAMGRLAPIEDELDAVAEAVALDLHAARDRIGDAVTSISGRITSLQSILKDAVASKLLEPSQIVSLGANLAALGASAEQIQATGSMRDVATLERDVASKEQEILDFVKVTQQQRLAAIIRATLAAQGFVDDQPENAQPGDVLNVVGTRRGYSTTGEADQRQVTFTVSPSCTVSYDFSGYVGESCLADEQRIFDALAQHGIYILDDEDMRRLQEREEITEDTLKGMAVKPVVNKRQAILASRMLDVLKEMGYQIIYRETIGDTIYFDASHDGQGFFSVTIDDKGTPQVFTDREHKRPIIANSDDDLLSHLRGEEADDGDIDEPSHVWDSGRTSQSE